MGGAAAHAHARHTHGTCTAHARRMHGICAARLRVACDTQARLREACKPDPNAPDHDSSTASDATSGEEGEGGLEGDEGEEEPLNEASEPPLDGSGLAFVRSLFGGSALRARPAALTAPAWPTRTPSESQMRAAV